MAAAERRLAEAQASGNVTVRFVMAQVKRGREVELVECEMHFAGGKLIQTTGHARFPLDPEVSQAENP